MAMMSPTIFTASPKPPISSQAHSCNVILHYAPWKMQRLSFFALKSMSVDLQGENVSQVGKNGLKRSFIGGLNRVPHAKVAILGIRRKRCISACLFSRTQIASIAFTWGTVSVLPFYTLMVLAPKAELTKKAAGSNVPYVLLGLLYAYLFYLSWTPATLRLMFASKYWLPELPGIARMFSNQIAVASAWIHLLAVDLFAARQVFHDGLKDKIETRHSITLCLLFCPIGILVHAITKMVTQRPKLNDASSSQNTSVGVSDHAV